jgi:hypothetical protein
MELEERRDCFRCPPTTNKKRVAPLRKFAPKNIKTATPICASVFGKVQCFFKRVDKKTRKKREGRGWLALFTKTSLFFTKFMQKLPSFTKFMQKLPSFTKNLKKPEKNFPLLQKNFPLLQKI